MSFENSTLIDGRIYGGTLGLTDSVLSGQGKTYFNGGRGGMGRAVSVFRSNAS